MPLEEIIIIVLCLALGGTIKGATGLGTPIVAVPALAVFFDVPFAIAVLLIPNLATNIIQMWQCRAERNTVPFLVPFVVAGGVGVGLGTLLLTTLSAPLLSAILGVIVLLYLVMRLARPHWQIARDTGRRIAPAVGFFAGALQGATGISAPVSVTFLNGMKLSREQFMLTISGLFVMFVVVQIPALAYAGIFTGERAIYSVFAMAPVLAAMPLGNWIARKLGPQAFDRMIMVLLAVIALKLFYDAAAGL